MKTVTALAVFAAVCVLVACGSSIRSTPSAPVSPNGYDGQANGPGAVEAGNASAAASSELPDLCQYLTEAMATELFGQNRWEGLGTDEGCGYSDGEQQLRLGQDTNFERVEALEKREQYEPIGTENPAPGHWELVSGIGAAAQRRQYGSDYGDKIGLVFLVNGNARGKAFHLDAIGASAAGPPDMQTLETVAATIAHAIEG